jgi:hypothetical protein
MINFPSRYPMKAIQRDGRVGERFAIGNLREFCARLVWLRWGRGVAFGSTAPTTRTLMRPLVGLDVRAGFYAAYAADVLRTRSLVLVSVVVEDFPSRYRVLVRQTC